MAMLRIGSSLCLKLAVVLGVVLGLDQAEGQCVNKRYRVVCYLASWSIYREGQGSFKSEYIVPNYCTHLIYTFAGLNVGGGIDSLDYHNDINVNKGFQQVMRLKEDNPCLKILLAVGGWNEGSEKYSLMAEREDTRNAFADQALRFIIHYGFDGLDVDWEYPTFRGGIDEDKQNFVLLLQALHDRFAHRGKLVTAALGASQAMLRTSYDMPKVCELLDFVNLMTYDYSVRNVLSIDAPLYRESTTDTESIDSTIGYIEKTGCALSKIVMGISTYGKTYTLQQPGKTVPGSNSTGPGAAGKFTKSPGTLGYNEICSLLKNNAQWTTKNLARSAVNYAYSKDQWMTYENQETVKHKTQYVTRKKLGGVMFWTIDTDDFQGECHNEAYPLVRAALSTLGYLK